MKLSPEDFPLIELVGGPAGHSIAAKMNGVDVPACKRVELDVGVDGLVEVTFTVMARVSAKLRGEVTFVDPSGECLAHAPGPVELEG